jgi:DNA repair exonuclease SbcCD ATPase subunit
MPNPPARRPTSARRPAAVAGQTEALRAEIERIQAEFADLEGKAQLSSVYATIGDFDARLVELPTTLEALRDRGYVHSGQLDDELEALDDRWDEVRPRVESALRTHVRRLDRELDETERRVNNIRTNRANISAAESAINGLSRQVNEARRAVEGLYEGMDLQLSEIASRIARVDQMMDLIDQSPEFRLLDAEGPLLAVNAEWQRDGEEGPEGVLFLTDQRLLFEQREEVVTKKVLGLFKAESEKTQNLLLDIQVDEIESVTHKEEGGFLGMGKDDILELVLAATAPVSRTRFHLKGQDSEDWAAMIKRVQTGGIDEDREDEYVDEIEEAEAIAAAFPSQCPNCFAELPAPPRGVSSVICEFCGTEITPVTDSADSE